MKFADKGFNVSFRKGSDPLKSLLSKLRIKASNSSVLNPDGYLICFTVICKHSNLHDIQIIDTNHTSHLQIIQSLYMVSDNYLEVNEKK